MDNNKLIDQVRDIMKAHYEGMKRMNMGSSDPEITKKDLYAQLQAFLPQLTQDMMPALYYSLEERGHATLVTNDTVTFSKTFVG